MSKSSTRPSMDERYTRYTLILSEIRPLIALLTSAYTQTENPDVEAALAMLEKLELREISLEQFWQQEEILEILRHPGRYPKAVRDWVRDYRDKEME